MLTHSVFTHMRITIHACSWSQVDTGTIPAMVVQRAMKAQVRQIHKLRQRLVKPQRGKNASSYTSSPPGAGDGSIVVPYRDSTVPYEDALPMVEFTRYTHDDCCH